MAEQPSPPSDRRSRDLIRLTIAKFRPQRLKSLWRWVAPGAKFVGVALVFSASAVGGVLLHLDTNEARSVTRKVVNAVLEPVFRGRIEVGEIQKLSLTSARIAEAHIFDPDGNEVIFAEGIDASILTPKLLWALLEGGEIPIDIPHARIERARVTLIPDPDLIPTIAWAFYPKNPGPPSVIPPPPVIVSLPHIEIGEASVTGSVGAPIEGEVVRVNASMLIRTDQALSLDVEETGVRLTELLPAVASGAASYHLRVDLKSATSNQVAPPSPPVVMWGDFGGELGDVPVSGNMRLTGLTLKSTVQLPRVEPGPLKGVLPWFPLETRATATLAADGTLPRLRLRGSAELTQGTGISTAIIAGAMDVTHGLRLDLDINAASLDPRTLFADAPEGRIDARAKIRLGIADGSDEPRVSFEVAAFAAEAFDQPIPAIDAAFELVRGELLGSFTVHEAGMPIDGRVSLVDGRVTFSALTSGASLSQNPRLAGLVDGNVRARVDGSFDKGLLQARITASGSGMAAGLPRAATADHMVVDAQLSGPPADLTLKGSTTLSGVTVSGEKLDTVRLDADGKLASPHVALDVKDASRGQITANAMVALADRKASGVRFKIDRQGERAVGQLTSLALTRGGVAIEGLRIDEGSVGALSGSLRLDGDELIGDLRGQNVDLQKLSRLLALPGGFAGLANLEVHVQKTRTGRKGTVELELERGNLLQVPGVSARISAKLDDEKVEASGYVRLVDEATDAERIEQRAAGQSALLCDGPIAEVRFANAAGTIKGPLLSLATWRTAVGSADVFAENWNLGCVARRIPKERRPFEELSGFASARFNIHRAREDKHASIADLSLGTTGLKIVGKEKSWESSKLDFVLNGQFDGRSGATEVNAAVFDDVILARAKATTTLDLDRVLSSAEERTKSLRSAPIDFTLSMPRRKISELGSLPQPLASFVPALDGELGATLQLGGTFNAPSAFIAMQAVGVLPAVIGKQREQWMPALNLDFTANYEPSTGRSLGGLAVALDRAPVAIVGVSVDLPVKGLTDPEEGVPLPWKADLNADFYELPLHAIPALADREVSGILSGTASLKGLNDQPSASLNLVLSTLRIHDEYLQGLIKGSVRGSNEPNADKSHARGDISIDLVEQDGGRLQVDGNLGVLWKGLTIPAPDPGSPGRLVLGAKHFGIAPAFPLVAGALTKLDGVLDGSAEIIWGQLGNTDKGRIERANLTLSDAVAYIPQFGQELHDGKAVIKSEPARADGLQELKVTGIEAQGIAGRVHGTASAVFDGLSLLRATAELSIDEGEELPITVEGVPLGKASGEVKLAATPRNEGIDIDATISKARFELPTSSTRDVISLDDAPGVRILPALAPAEEKRDAAAWQYAFKVAVDDAEVRSQSLNLNLSTPKDAPIRLLLSDRLHVTGDVTLTEGSIVLNKKTFDIDDGLVRLRDEDSGNPYVSLTAHWEATDGGRVFVDYVGLLKPITDDKIRFRSDPPRSQEEIIQLLVFGESAATATSLAGTVGSTFASSFANDLIGTAFGGVLRDVLALNVGTTDSGGYLGAQVKLSDSFRFGGSVEQVQDTSTTAGQRAGSCGDLFFDYKFTTNWSLRGSGGYCGYDNQSTTSQDGVTLGLDVLWQFRY